VRYRKHLFNSQPNPTRERGILWDCTSLAHASGCDVSFACGKTIKATSPHASGWDEQTRSVRKNNFVA
jgi:hypothetical protein